MHTNVPGRAPIKLKAFYPSFKWYYPDCELETKKWFVKAVKPDWTIIDVGANIGYYSILFAQLAPKGRVYAIEPTCTYDMLRTNLAQYPKLKVRTRKVAMGDKVGNYKDNIFRIWGKGPETMQYDFITMDEFVKKEKLKRVDAIKIDVDSYDLEVLKGSVETIKRFNPFIVVELNAALLKRGQSREEAFEWMRSLGYRSPKIFDTENYLYKLKKWKPPE